MKNTLMNGGHSKPGWIYSAAERSGLCLKKYKMKMSLEMNKIIKYLFPIFILTSCHSSIEEDILLIEKDLFYNQLSYMDEKAIKIPFSNESLELSFRQLVKEYPLRNNLRQGVYLGLSEENNTSTFLKYLSLRYMAEYYESRDLDNKLRHNEIIGNTYHVGFLTCMGPENQEELRIETKINYDTDDLLPFFVDESSLDTTILDPYQDAILLRNRQRGDTIRGEVWIYNTLNSEWLPYNVSIVN